MEHTALKSDIEVTPEAVSIQPDVCINVQWTTKKVETQTGKQDNNAEPTPTPKPLLTFLLLSFPIAMV